MPAKVALSTVFGAAAKLAPRELLSGIDHAGAGGVVLDASLDEARLDALTRALAARAHPDAQVVAVSAPLAAGRAALAQLCALDRAEAETALACALATVRRAGTLGARFVLLRLGEVAGLSAEWTLARDRFQRADLDEYLASRLNERRDRAAHRPLDVARRALDRLARAAESASVTLLLPNPRRFVELPSPREVGYLLADAAGAPLAPALDFAAAHLPDAMGLCPIDVTADAFGAAAPFALIGDACGPIGALAPGRGLLDVAALLGGLPKETTRAFSPFIGLDLDEVRDAITGLGAL